MLRARFVVAGFTLAALALAACSLANELCGTLCAVDKGGATVTCPGG
jgi:hypothetical protein